jgi:hypothetical protein
MFPTAKHCNCATTVDDGALHSGPISYSTQISTATSCLEGFAGAVVSIPTNLDSETPPRYNVQQLCLKPRWTLYTSQVLASDILALLISCQLLGLLDILRDPAFLNSGGWLQPVTTLSTLSALVQRFSVNAAVYLTSAVVVQRQARSQRNIGLQQDEEDVVISALWTATVFSLLRILLDVAILVTATSAVQWTTLSLPTSLLQVVRECYVVSLSTVAGRYLYHQLYR